MVSPKAAAPARRSMTPGSPASGAISRVGQADAVMSTRTTERPISDKARASMTVVVEPLSPAGDTMAATGLARRLARKPATASIEKSSEVSTSSSTASSFAAATASTGGASVAVAATAGRCRCSFSAAGWYAATGMARAADGMLS
ncbi:hypothetical protein D3C86_1626020 [compost metagenome]